MSERRIEIRELCGYEFHNQWGVHAPTSVCPGGNSVISEIPDEWVEAATVRIMELANVEVYPDTFQSEAIRPFVPSILAAALFGSTTNRVPISTDLVVGGGKEET
jgi:hypothetical protein